MNRLFAPTALVVMGLALAGCGVSGSYGGIAAIDNTAHTVKLYTNDTFLFPATVDLSKFKVGDEVHIAFALDPATKKNNATAIWPYP